MIDEVNRTLVVVAVLGVVAAFAAGAWLTNLGGGPGGSLGGSGVNPNDWGAAANAICSDTNAEVVDFDQSLGTDAGPAESLARGAEILARRADGLAELPRPSAGAADVDLLVSAMRETEVVMLRIRDAVEAEALEEADRLALGLDSEQLTRLSYNLDAPWCDLFGADEGTIRTTASVNLLEVQSLLEQHRQEAGTYAGADIELLRERYGTELVPGEASIHGASATGYCVESTVGYLTLHVQGPGEGEPIGGSC